MIYNNYGKQCNVREDAMINSCKNSGLLIRAAKAEDYPEIREFLLESSFLYPGIELWWDNRVAQL